MAEPTPEALVTDLLELLTLKPAGEDRFEGPRKVDGIGRVFGGQVIAQALVAAQSTVDTERPAQEIGVQRMRGTAFADRRLRGDERLGDDLPAEHPADPVNLARPFEAVLAERLERQQLE